VFVSGAVVWDGVGVSGVWAAVLVGSCAVVGLAENWAIMNAGGRSKGDTHDRCREARQD